MRKSGTYSAAPWIISLGPASVISLAHCCTSTSWDFYTPSSGKRKGDKLLKFLLFPVNKIVQEENDKPFDKTELSLAELRKQAMKNGGRPCKGKTTSLDYKKASAAIKRYAKLRANGECENCNRKAPFLDRHGIPFLEVHHLFRLADDGPDSPDNVAAICPNCHREVHHGKRSGQIKKSLTKIIETKELAI